MARILVIEDDPSTVEEITVQLAACGHDPVAVGDGREGLGRACREPFDAITLDRMLPGLDGLEVVSELRSRGVTTPVLMISALSDIDERIAGLRAGGDDYLVKPFAPDEMAARVEVMLRRALPATQHSMIRVGDLAIDLIERRVTVAGEPVRLLHMEFRLLAFLARNAGQTVSRRMIFEQVWGYFFDPGANLINVHIARLRRKIERPEHPAFITTVKSEGYRLDAP
ncbi:response regulator transcription factor [Sphingomonas hankookensis]|uniref:DNA-binding response regulator n=1 Tax=Sphingomonas hengshuiensis TaxID=1609977 RepID=A0A2W5B6P5_9SPHN|nr:MAG: DNA-binding response regulator [Sphingomonas hengshuiensis]